MFTFRLTTKEVSERFIRQRSSRSREILLELSGMIQGYFSEKDSSFLKARKMYILLLNNYPNQGKMNEKNLQKILSQLKNLPASRHRGKILFKDVVTFQAWCDLQNYLIQKNKFKANGGNVDVKFRCW